MRKKIKFWEYSFVFVSAIDDIVFHHFRRLWQGVVVPHSSDFPHILLDTVHPSIYIWHTLCNTFPTSLLKTCLNPFPVSTLNLKYSPNYSLFKVCFILISVCVSLLKKLPWKQTNSYLTVSVWRCLNFSIALNSLPDISMWVFLFQLVSQPQCQELIS